MDKVEPIPATVGERWGTAWTDHQSVSESMPQQPIIDFSETKIELKLYKGLRIYRFSLSQKKNSSNCA